MRLSEALGWVNARVVFGAVYLLMVVPYGAVFRLLGKRPLDLRFDPGAASYRTPAEVSPPARMEKPY